MEPNPEVKEEVPVPQQIIAKVLVLGEKSGSTEKGDTIIHIVETLSDLATKLTNPIFSGLLE